MLLTNLAAKFRLSASLVILMGAGLALGDGTAGKPDVLMDAMADELARSMDQLVLGDLPKPYFIQYGTEERRTVSMQAAYGGLLFSSDDRARTFTSQVRVGSYVLDNTSSGRGSGGRTSLPLDNDYDALRHAMWRVTDGDYKRAVETLTRKLAFLKEKNVEDRPDDFSRVDPVQAVEPLSVLDLDKEQWESNVKKLSALFNEFPQIQDADVAFFGGAVNEWIVNSEGTRLRKADSGVYVEVRADIQAAEGMRLSDSRQYLGLQVDQLPPLEKMLADARTMCEKLIALSEAPMLDYYVGPVLFEPIAAGKVFESLLSDGVCARPVPLGSGGWGDDSFEKKIGLRILPRSFEIYDDPTTEWFEGKLLAGAYTFDDDAVRPKRVDLVERGKLLTLLASRAPTRKIKQTTGHGRGGFGSGQAHIGCLYVSDKDGVSAAELREELIEAARAEGLEFALRVEAMESGGFGYLGDPVYAYKVYVKDGREELVRGLEFGHAETRVLKDILASGKERKVYNSTSGTTSSVIAPAIVIEELELNKPEREFDKLPILKRPDQRAD